MCDAMRCSTYRLFLQRCRRKRNWVYRLRDSVSKKDARALSHFWRAGIGGLEKSCFRWRYWREVCNWRLARCRWVILCTELSRVSRCNMARSRSTSRSGSGSGSGSRRVRVREDIETGVKVTIFSMEQRKERRGGSRKRQQRWGVQFVFLAILGDKISVGWMMAWGSSKGVCHSGWIGGEVTWNSACAYGVWRGKIKLTP